VYARKPGDFWRFGISEGGSIDKAESVLKSSGVLGVVYWGAWAGRSKDDDV